MGKKIALSSFYTFCIFFCLILGYLGLTGKRFDFIMAATFGGTIFVILKIKLMKEIRNTLKP